MIDYKSTRGDKKQYSFSEAVLKGIAEDGGLFIPNNLPMIAVDQLQSLLGKSYQEQAGFMINLFESDLPKSVIEKVISQAYSSNFDTPLITPVVQLKTNQFVLELWHGPTASFKDMALQLMPLLFSEAIKINPRPLNYLILVATSGDTGKAALEGYKDKKGISIIVFYPKGHVSQLQELQMVTQEGSNLAVYNVEGDFDFTQNLVKTIFNDFDLNKKLLIERQTILSSANSINWGRLIPQIIYHLRAYLSLVEQKAIKLGETADICVPTGNFGNIMAAFYAKRMGLPVGKLICASNANNVLTEFLSTGVYDINKRRLSQTPSPSMDILIASNIERLLYEITQDTKEVSKWMNDLKIKGRFEVDSKTKVFLKREFYSDWVSNQDCLLNIKNVFGETGYLMDPHTSVAQLVAERYSKKSKRLMPTIICSTAHWSKFAGDVYRAVFKSEGVGMSEFEMLDKIKGLKLGLSIPKSIAQLKNKPILYSKSYDPKDVEKLLNFFN